MKTRGWRNWQTHYLEVVAPARAWRFESSPAHHIGLPDFLRGEAEVRPALPAGRANLSVRFQKFAKSCLVVFIEKSQNPF